MMEAPIRANECDRKFLVPAPEHSSPHVQRRIEINDMAHAARNLENGAILNCLGMARSAGASKRCDRSVFDE
jgi:hypothetical protein